MPRKGRIEMVTVDEELEEAARLDEVRRLAAELHWEWWERQREAQHGADAESGLDQAA